MFLLTGFESAQPAYTYLVPFKSRVPMHLNLARVAHISQNSDYFVDMLISPRQGNQKEREFAISREAFASFFVDKIPLLCQDLPATIDTVRE